MSNEISLSNTQKGKLIIVSGPSGVGKTSICRALCDTFVNLRWSISATSRPQRIGETDGTDYYFLTEREFLQRVEAGEFLEYTKVHGFYYGTLAKPIEETLLNGKSCLLDIDVRGAANIKKQSKYDILLIFIAPPSLQSLEQRLVSRGRDSRSDIDQRLQNAAEELKMSFFYDYQIVNENLQETISLVENLVKNLVQIM